MRDSPIQPSLEYKRLLNVLRYYEGLLTSGQRESAASLVEVLGSPEYLSVVASKVDGTCFDFTMVPIASVGDLKKELTKQDGSHMHSLYHESCVNGDGDRDGDGNGELGSDDQLRFLRTPGTEPPAVELVVIMDNAEIVWQKTDGEFMNINGDVVARTRAFDRGAWSHGTSSQVTFDRSELVQGVKWNLMSNGKAINVGLSSTRREANRDPRSDQGYDFSLHMGACGMVRVFERGQKKHAHGLHGGTPTAQDVFSISVCGHRVEYARNGETFYVSSTVPEFPLRIETSFRHQGGAIKIIKLVTNEAKGDASESA